MAVSWRILVNSRKLLIGFDLSESVEDREIFYIFYICSIKLNILDYYRKYNR